ncbi:hypothetical protein GQ457_15G005420 [Hibiscus cannabinus]
MKMRNQEKAEEFAFEAKTNSKFHQSLRLGLLSLNTTSIFAEKCFAVHKKRLKHVKVSLPMRFGIKQSPTKTESDQNRSNLKV